MNGFWAVAALALLIAAVSIVVGHWSPGVFMGLLLFVLVGSLYPPLGIFTLGIVLFYLVFWHGPALSGKANQLVGGQAK